MPDATPVETLKQYVLSNGSSIISNQQVAFYTPNEILKIEVAGAMMVIAVLVLTYVGYAYAMRKYQMWANQQDLEDQLAAGIDPDPDNLPPLPKKPNRMLLFVIGGLVMVAGIAMFVMPS